MGNKNSSKRRENQESKVVRVEVLSLYDDDYDDDDDLNEINHILIIVEIGKERALSLVLFIYPIRYCYCLPHHLLHYRLHPALSSTPGHCQLIQLNYFIL